MSRDNIYVIAKELCDSTLACLKACPVDSIFMFLDQKRPDDSFMYIDSDTCIGCGQCEPECPNNAIFHIMQLPDQYKNSILPNPPGPDERRRPDENEGGGGGGRDPKPDKKPWSHDQDRFKNKAKEVLDKYNTSKFKQAIDAAGIGDGIRSLSMEAMQTAIKNVGGELTKDVKILSKASPLGKIAFIGTVFDGIDTYVAFTDGEITNEDWVKAGTFVVGALGYVPGPVGIVATGISLGIAVYNSTHN